MEKTNVGIELNTNLYKQLDDVCEDLGMSVEEAFQIFARKVVNEQGIPFEITEKEYPTDEKKEALVKTLKIAGCISVVVALVAGLIALLWHSKPKEKHRW